jgi:PAS domain S-box-containing protein
MSVGFTHDAGARNRCAPTSANTIMPHTSSISFTACRFDESTMSTNDSESSQQKVRQEDVDLTITDAIPVDITVLAADGTVLFVNQYTLDRLGLSAHDVKDKGYLRQTCHPDDLGRVLDERRIGLSKGVSFELEMRLFSKNGRHRWHLAQYNPLKDKRGQIIRWYMTATDIDDRKTCRGEVAPKVRNICAPLPTVFVNRLWSRRRWNDTLREPRRSGYNGAHPRHREE